MNLALEISKTLQPSRFYYSLLRKGAASLGFYWAVISIARPNHDTRLQNFYLLCLGNEPYIIRVILPVACDFEALSGSVRTQQFTDANKRKENTQKDDGFNLDLSQSFGRCIPSWLNVLEAQISLFIVILLTLLTLLFKIHDTLFNPKFHASKLNPCKGQRKTGPFQWCRSPAQRKKRRQASLQICPWQTQSSYRFLLCCQSSI